MKVLGIDPGTATTGYGIVRIEEKGKVVPMKHGLIETSKDTSPEKRLESIHVQLLHVFKKYKPDVMAMEKLFFATNAKTAIRVGQAQGVLLLAAANAKTKVFEYAPGTIKKIVTGDGRADKKVMHEFVKKILGRSIKSKPGKKTHFDNEVDALAVALCHIVKEEGVKLKNGQS